MVHSPLSTPVVAIPPDIRPWYEEYGCKVNAESPDRRGLPPPAAVLVVLAFFASCEGRPAPSVPTPLPAVATPPAVPLPPNASLVIEQPFVIVHPQLQGDPFGYIP